MDLISIVVPCYNEEEVLPAFYTEITKVMGNLATEKNINYEVIFVDDGSKDKTLPILEQYAQADTHVKYISFSRNFGKEAAMLAGFEKAKGEFIAVMDGDLQNPPSFLPLMYADLKTGEYDCIATRRKDRNGEEKFRSWLSVKFYDIMNKMSDTKVIKSTQDFRMMSRQYLDAVLSMREYNRFSKGIFAWVGFRIKYMPYDNIERAAGTTSWPLWKLFLYAIEGIVSFSVAPLAISIVLGAITAFIGFVMFILAFIGLFTDSFTSDTMAIFASIFFVGGLIMGCMGTLGLYISKSYTEIKNRPVYIVRCSNINS